MLTEKGNYNISLASIARTSPKAINAKSFYDKLEEVTIGNGTVTMLGLEHPLGQQYTLARTSSIYTPTEAGLMSCSELQAQEQDKHEFSIWGASGLSSLKYKPTIGN